MSGIQTEEPIVDDAPTQARSRILVVDDEQGILNAVRRELSTPPFGRHHCEVETYNNPLLALERAKVEKFDAVVSDYRMPEMNGLDFLRELAKLQPDCGRIVLSGQTDFDTLIEMINETHIYRFIPKPWSSHFLKSSIDQALDFCQSSIENRRLAKLLTDNGVRLPTSPAHAVDQILVMDRDIQVANDIARPFTRRCRLDDVFRVLQAEAGEGRLADLKLANVNVHVSDTAEHALEMADDLTFSCAISNYHMPGMDVAQFLTRFIEKQPDCACIMLSGEVDMESVVVALDFADLHAFIAKPWTEFELHSAVAQALARRRLQLDTRALAAICKSHNVGGIH